MDLPSMLKTKRAPPPPPPRKPPNLQSQSKQPPPPPPTIPQRQQQQGSNQPNQTNQPSNKKGLGWPWDNPPTLFPLFTSTSSTTPSTSPPSSISWLTNWELWVPPGLPQNIEWIPCLRTASQINDLTPFLRDITRNQQRRVTALLGFNEPEIPSQANMNVSDAVGLWRDYVIPAKREFGLRLGSPGMSSDVGLCKPWLDGFLAELKGKDEVEFLVLHWYGARFVDMKLFLEDMHRTYGRPVWVNEFACSAMGNGEVREEDVIRFMEEAVPWLEATEWVEKYAYFGNAQGRDVGEWVGRASNFTEEVAEGCEDTDGRRLSRVGERYLRL